MAENVEGPPPGADPNNPPAPTPPARRRRRWPYVLLGILLLVAVLAFFAPQLASTPAARAFVLDRINRRIDGQLTISDWSLSWTGGTTVRGLRLLDAAGAQVLQVEQLTTELSVWDALRGNYFAFGKTTGQGIGFTAERHPDGSTNFQKIFGTESRGSALPPISGSFDLDVWGIFVDAERSNQAVALDRSRVQVSVSDINAQIQHDLDLNIRVGAGSSGKLLAKGWMDLFENNRFDARGLKGDEALVLQRLDLASLLPLIPIPSFRTLAGVTDGQFTLQLQGGDQITVRGTSTTSEFILAGPFQDGEKLQRDQITIEIPSTTFNRTTGRIRIGETDQDAITIRSGADVARLSAATSLNALTRMVRNETPGEEGNLALHVHLDAPGTARQLPKTLGLAEGVTVSEGGITHTLQVTLHKESAEARVKLVAGLRGTRVDAKGQARPIQISDIALSGTATSVGGGGAIPELRDFVLSLTSGFASINGSGKTLDDLALAGNADLAKAQAELAQFRPMPGLELNGATEFKVTSSGDLTRSGGKSQLDLAVSGTSLLVRRASDRGPRELINEPWLQITGNGTLIRGGKGAPFIERIQDGLLTFQAGDKQKPSVLGRLVSLSAVPLPGGGWDVPSFEIAQLTGTVAALQEFPYLEQILDQLDLKLASGTISVQAKGSVREKNLRLTAVTVAASEITLQQLQSDESAVDILRDYSATGELAGLLSASATGIDARLGKLAWTDEKQGVLTLRKTSQGDLLFRWLKGGSEVLFDGRIEIAADLPKLNAIVRPLTGRQVVAEGREGYLRSGILKGIVAASHTPGGQTKVEADKIVLSQLTIAGRPVKNETVTVSLAASMSPDLSRVTAQRLNVKGSFVSLDGSASIQLPRRGSQETFSSLDYIQSASLNLNADAARLHAFIDAFIPEAQPPAADVPADKPLSRRRRNRQQAPVMPEKALPPLVVRSGSLAASLAIERREEGLNLIGNKITGTDLAFDRGPQRAAANLRTVDLTFTALLVPARAGQGGSMFGELTRLEVTKLSGRTDIGDVKMAEPITVRFGQDFGATGAMEVPGQLGPLLAVVAALRGDLEKEQTTGQGNYRLAVRFQTRGQAVAINANASVDDLLLRTPEGREFSEKSVRLASQLTLDRQAAASTLTIDTLTLDLPTSQALGVRVSGAIEDFDRERRFRNVRVLLSYDAAKAMDMIAPLLSPAARQGLNDVQLAGRAKEKPFDITGSFPVDLQRLPRNVQQRGALHMVGITGELILDEVRYRQEVARKLVLPILFDEGLLTIAYPKRRGERFPPPAELGGGKLDLGGLQVDVLAEHPRLSSIRKDHLIVDRAKVGTEFLAALGEFHPLFSGPAEASGVLTLEATELTSVPIDRTIQRTGRAHAKYTLENLTLRTNLMNEIASQLRLNPTITLGRIRNATMQVENGIVRSDLTLQFDNQILGFRNGVVRLSDRQILDMTMTIPAGLLERIDTRIKLVKPTFEVPIRGTLARPEIDIVQAAVRNLVPDNPLDLLDLLKGGREQRDATNRSDRPRDRDERPRDRREKDPPPGTIGKPSPRD